MIGGTSPRGVHKLNRDQERAGLAAQTPALALFFLSGATSLVYQVVWIRMLTLVFGASIFAFSTVVAVFMAGLALGSYSIGRAADRLRVNKLVLFGLCEGCVGLYALATPALVGVLEAMNVWLVGRYGFSFGLNSAFRAAATASILIVPTMLMGGTFPLLSKHFLAKDDDVGIVTARLYWVNTSGAVAGTLLAGFVLIYAFGMRMTIGLTACVNISICLACLLLARRRVERVDHLSTGEHRASPGALTGRAAIFLVASYFVVGFVSLLYEVAWTRALNMIFGTSVYASATILAAILCGIALGSAYMSQRLKHEIDLAHLFASFQIRIGIWVVLFLAVAIKLPIFLLWLSGSMAGSFGAFHLIQYLLVFLSLLLPTALMGASFPLVNRLFVSGYKAAGRQIGTVYALNTLGCVLGSLTTGFLLIPAIGTRHTITVGIVTSLAIGLAVLFVLVRSKRVIPLVYAAVAVGLLAVIPPWDLAVFNSGWYVYAFSDWRNPGQWTASPSAHLLKGLPPPTPVDSSETERPGNKDGEAAGEVSIEFFKEGLNSTVAVTRDAEGIVTVRLNGKADASTDLDDMRTQLLLGHIPMLLHADPREILVIGLGSGVTAGAMGAYPVNSIKCLELEASIAEAANFFKKENRGILEDPRFDMTIEDARVYLNASPDRFDVISSEPSNLWMGGVSNLFTREFFTHCRDALSAGGLMCQWVHIYGLSLEDLKMIVGTFTHVFPNTSVWMPVEGRGDLILIGRTEAGKIPFSRIASRLKWSPIIEDMRSIGIHYPETLLTRAVCLDSGARAFSAGSGLNTDDHPVLEFSAARSVFVQRAASNLSALVRASEGTGEQITALFALTE